MGELRLHANESAWGAAAGVLDNARPDRVWQYPEDGGLEAALATRLGVDPSRVVLGNGSTELISLLILSLTGPDDAVATCAGSFIAYRTLTQATGRRLQLSAPCPGGGIDLDALRSVIDAQTRLVFIANPDNPSGTLLSEADLRGFLDSLPEDGPVVVLDEAYREYVEDTLYPAPTALLGPGVVLLRTFSKAYGLAGLRCGYAVSGLEISTRLRAIGGPFRVGRLTRNAATAALTDQAHLARVIEDTARQRRWLLAALRRLGLEVTDSHTSFVMVTLGKRTGEIAEALWRQGVRVQTLHNYGRPESLRITVGRLADNQRLIAALSDSFESPGRAS